MWLETENCNITRFDLIPFPLFAAGDDVREGEEHKSSHSVQEEDSDCPRDSGCFIPSECSDTKEDAEQLTETGLTLTCVLGRKVVLEVI